MNRIRKAQPGTKIEKIRYHIREIETDRIEKNVKNITRKHGLEKSWQQVMKKQREAFKAMEQFKSKCRKLGVQKVKRWKEGRYYYCWGIDEHAIDVPERVIKKLSRAQALYDVGKEKEAKKLCDELIEEYGIGAP